MLKFISLLLVFLLVSCSSREKIQERSEANEGEPSAVAAHDTVEVAQPEPEVQPQPQVTTVKPNLSLIGAVISSIEFVDSVRYKAHIELRTAIPIGGLESIAEPGQSLVVQPAYRADGEGKIMLSDPLNRKLFEARLLKNGDFLFGKISLHQDGIWYLEDTGLD